MLQLDTDVKLIHRTFERTETVLRNEPNHLTLSLLEKKEKEIVSIYRQVISLPII